MTDTQPHLVTPSATAESLLVHAQWMRTLARHLVQDPHRADDVVQQSFLTALERPPRHNANLRGWLRRVVTNRARDAARGSERRAARERSAASAEAAPATDSLVLAAETQRELVDAILRLEEPFRSTILLRYFRGSSPEQIASESGVAASTVRVRTKRALDRLRCELDARSGGDRSKWTHALLPVVGPGLVAALSLQAKAIVGVAVAAALLCTAAWLGSGGAPGGDGVTTVPFVDSGDVLEIPTSEASDVQVAELSRAERAPIVADPEDDADASTGTYSGSFIGSVRDPDGTPIAGATMRVYPTDREPWSEQTPIVVGATDEGGRFELPVPEGLPTDRRVVVQAESEGHSSFSTNVIEPGIELPITLNWASTVTARVVDDVTLDPIPDVRVSFDSKITKTNSMGVFELPDIPVADSQRLTLVHEDYALTAVPIAVPRRPSEELTITLRRGVRLRARVVDEVSRAPIAGARIWHMATNERWTTDDAGRFSMSIAPGVSTSFHVTRPGYATFAWYFNWVGDEDPLEFEIPMRELAAITGVLLDDSDRPIANAYLFAGQEGSNARKRKVVVELPGFTRFELPRGLDEPTDADGRFSIPVLPGARPFRIHGGHAEFVSVDHSPVHVTAPGEQVEIEVRQERGATISGSVRRNGEPMPHTRVRCTPSGAKPIWATSGIDGTFELRGVPVGAAVVEVIPIVNRSDPAPDPVTLQAVQGEVHEIEFNWSDPREPIEGRLVDDTGAPVKGVAVGARRRAESGYRSFSARTNDEGRFRIEVRPGAPYTVTAGKAPKFASVEGVSPGSRDVELRFHPVGYFILRLLDARTGSLISLDHRLVHPVLCSIAGEHSFRHGVEIEARADGILCKVGLGGELENVDVDIDPRTTGYTPVRLDDVQLSATEHDATLIEVRLERGVACVLRLVDRALLEKTEEVLVFVLAEDEIDDVEGPFARGDARTNHKIGGTRMWVARPSLVHRVVHFDEAGEARARNLGPGTYVVRSYAEDSVEELGRFELTDDAQVVELGVE